MDLFVKNGRIYLPHGVSYQVLALPDHKVLSLKALRKVKELVENGATIIGEKPLTTASLVGGSEAEKELKNITEQLWNTVGANSIRPLTAKEALKNKGILPDCEFIKKPEGKAFDYIHRQLENVDYYFISNQNKESLSLTAAFRITGKQPELWDAVTGEITKATNFYEEKGRTFIDLSFNPYGSVFVVFRPLTPRGRTKKYDVKPSKHINKNQTLSGSWEVEFDSKWGGKTIKMDSLISWTNHPDEGIKYYSGTAKYKITFDSNSPSGGWGDRRFGAIDLGIVKDVGIAKVKLNGKDLGILWCPPYQVSVAGMLKEKGNILEIEVVNTWRNRLIGDRGKPQNERFTQTNITIKPDWKLEPSGLLGPVQLLKVSEK